jgi:hypothetical protein
LGLHADSSIRENARRERGLCLAGFQKRIWLSEKSLLNLRCRRITMVQATDSRKGLNLPFTRVIGILLSGSVGAYGWRLGSSLGQEVWTMLPWVSNTGDNYAENFVRNHDGRRGGVRVHARDERAR